MNIIKLKYFKLSEFDSKDLPGSGKFMKASTLRKLDLAREIAEVPFVIHSGYRTPAHNARVGGVPNSSHIKGHAVDIAASDSMVRMRVVMACLRAGFPRIGIYATFIHVDDDPTLPQGAMWVGGAD